MDGKRLESANEGIQPISLVFRRTTKDNLQVYLPAIDGHVPSEMVRTLRAFLEFCYLVRQNVINKKNSRSYSKRAPSFLPVPPNFQGRQRGQYVLTTTATLYEALH